MSTNARNGVDESRGSGFVHLNTPATIHYTAGQTISLSALRQPKTRVEGVALPESMTLWRKAFARYSKDEGYPSYAADIEDERAGDGPILPSLVPQRSGPVRRRAGEKLSPQDSFFCLAWRTEPSCSPHEKTPPSVPKGAVQKEDERDVVRERTGDGDQCHASSSSTPSAASARDGITIVSHHKVAGRQQFVYPDHDGVLSAGVVPQVVVTTEDKAEEEAAKVFYISPLNMSGEELEAFEELQALWRSRARSHSFLGTQHRQAAKGAEDPASLAGEHGALKAPRREGTASNASLAARNGITGKDSGFYHAEEEEVVIEEFSLNAELAEALRMADELLRFA